MKSLESIVPGRSIAVAVSLVLALGSVARATADQETLRSLLTRHVELTGSAQARMVLDNWRSRLPYFVKVLPLEYRKALGRMNMADAATQREEKRPE